jgi:simple sugar transport system permease protein
VLGGTSLMGGKFSIAGTVIGVFTIQTLISTITFLGVPPAASPVFMATAVIIVVLIQSRRVHRAVRSLIRSLRSLGGSAEGDDASARTAQAGSGSSGDESARDETKVTSR